MIRNGTIPKEPIRMETSNKPRKDILARFIEFLQHPMKLRIFVAITTMSVWYFFLASPMATEIDESARKLAEERKRIALGTEIEALRVDLNRFKNRLPKGTDSNEWMQYILEGMHGSPLKLNMLDPEPTKDIGPYKVAVLRVSVQGTFREIDEFLRWIDGNDRLFRIDEIRLQPNADGKSMSAQLILLGVMG